MISLTRLDGRVFALNADLIERIEPAIERPGAVVTLVDGDAYAVTESMAEVITAVRTFRASLVALSGTIQTATALPGLHVVPNLEGQ
jgi:flagellar protein FlbD